MLYKQERIQKKNQKASTAKIKIKNIWREAVIEDKDGNVLPFPCYLEAGEHYFIRTKDEVDEN